MPDEITDRLEATVPISSRSHALARKIDDLLERKRQESLRREIIAGCQEMADEYQAFAETYYSLDLFQKCPILSYAIVCSTPTSRIFVPNPLSA